MIKRTPLKRSQKPIKAKRDKPRASKGLFKKKPSKVDEWNKVRAELKLEFEAKGIISCEMCGSTFGLSFAHSKKRRNIVGEEIREVALLCIDPCHTKLELGPEAEMTTIIRAIIACRE